MTNLEVAECFVENAIAYGKDKNIEPEGRVEILMSNLKCIDKLLKNPMDENLDHDWDDFK